MKQNIAAVRHALVREGKEIAIQILNALEILFVGKITAVQTFSGGMLIAALVGRSIIN